LFTEIWIIGQVTNEIKYEEMTFMFVYAYNFPSSISGKFLCLNKLPIQINFAAFDEVLKNVETFPSLEINRCKISIRASII
jgi:hypothetical protein